MAESDSIVRRRSGAGRPRNKENEGLPYGVYRRVRNGIARYYDAEGRALGPEVPSEPLPTMGRFMPRVIMYRQVIVLNHDDLVQRSEPLDGICGVYVLLKGDQVVYVGQSKNMHYRVQVHKACKKDFDRVTYIPCPPDLLNEMEAAYIRAYEPPLNTIAPAIKTDRAHREAHRARMRRQQLLEARRSTPIDVAANQEVGDFST